MNKMSSLYLSSSNQTSYKRFSKFSLLVSLLLTFFVGFTFIISMFNTTKSVEVASADDPIQWFMCYFGDDSPTAYIYQTTQSSDLQFSTLSRSAVTYTADSNVDSGLNSLLNITGSNFKEINESILGVSLDGVSSANTNTDVTYNQGVRVNPFDRFGVSGLNFSYYMGEWKYLVVDACAGTDPIDPHAGLYYTGRLEPESTWSDILKTKDVRTAQFGSSSPLIFQNTLINLIANIIFSVTKTMVVLTITFINISFSDIVTLFGINDMIGSENGIFEQFFNGIFTPFILIAFAMTAGSMLWNGIVKKQYREAMSTLVRSISLYMAAIIFSITPTFMIALPNNAAVLGQTIILNTMNMGLQNNSEICATEVGDFNTVNIIDSSTGQVTTKVEENQSILSQASKTMSSQVGCQYWETFLFDPWVQGQWGTTWDQLWANDMIPEWAPEGSNTLGNLNTEMVGDAGVPLGDGTIVNNWALYQLSTQTNAHAPTGLEGQLSKYSSGVANDWWRIVDATSNYQEENVETSVSGSGNNKQFSIQYNVPKNNPTTEVWGDWVGNNSYNKILIALSSLIIAAIGLAAPFFFALSSAVYSIGIALLMSISPIMFLIGIWGNRGWEFFKGWAELLINNVIKRIVVALLLALSISFTSAAIEMMQTTGWIEGVALLIIMSFILIRGRKQIFDTLGAIRLSSSSFGQIANKVSSSTTGILKSSGRMAGSAVAGGVSAKRYGGAFSDGALSGAKTELKSQLYKNNSEFSRSALTAYDDINIDHNRELADQDFICSLCGVNLRSEKGGEDIIVGRDGAGNYYCRMCMEESNNPDIREILIDNSEVFRNEKIEAPDRLERMRERSMDESIDSYISSAEKSAVETIDNAKRFDLSASVNIDPQLAPFIDMNTLNNAYKMNNFDYIERAISFAVYRKIISVLQEGDTLPDNYNVNSIYERISNGRPLVKDYDNESTDESYPNEND